MGLFNFKDKISTPPTPKERLGKAWLMVIGKNKKQAGLDIMKTLDKEGCTEATIACAMFETDSEERKRLVKKAADAHHSEGLWQYSGFLPHSPIPDPENAEDALWEKYCLAAAEGGSTDAMNEMGNVFHRRKNYAESMYWYAMAHSYGFPNSEVSLLGIAKKWADAGSPYEFIKGSPKFDEQRFKCAVAYLEMYSSKEMTINPAEIIAMALDKVPLAAYLAGSIVENIGNYKLAYKIYNAISMDNDCHGLKCCADMIFTGKGTEKDLKSAVNMYTLAAEFGDPAAMFTMGELTKSINKNLAAYWYGTAHSRGYAPALARLQEMSKKLL